MKKDKSVQLRKEYTDKKGKVIPRVMFRHYKEEDIEKLVKTLGFESERLVTILNSIKNFDKSFSFQHNTKKHKNLYVGIIL
jgi:hypothetical protein